MLGLLGNTKVQPNLQIFLTVVRVKRIAHLCQLNVKPLSKRDIQFFG
ncbi:hypothetical protein GXM_00666 [Nostoc sphaeroides CCNUC1]|uniref:Uncharacterized protein n=1 Tax=Nostoc sphaeroides CCNUC1 TaxID=2653204 RepID=A0A5P8VRX9_9NOSO|nr:hypothetical protein GXM_00666 [Nostoc sphaeroides CCNUC1]